MACMRDHDDFDAVADHRFEHIGETARRDRIVFRLQIQNRRLAAGEILVDRSVIARPGFGFVGFRIPAAQPHRGVVARREEGLLQIFQALRGGQAQVARAVDGLAHLGVDRHFLRIRRHLAGRAGGNHQALYQIRTIRGQLARFEITPGMANHHHRPLLLGFHHIGDALGEIMHVLILHRAGAGADAARFRTDHAEAGFGQIDGDSIVVAHGTAQRRQNHDDRTLALREDFGRQIAVLEQLAFDPGRIGRGGQRGAGGGHAAKQRSGGKNGFLQKQFGWIHCSLLIEYCCFMRDCIGVSGTYFDTAI